MAAPSNANRLRRVVTGHDKAGRSYVMEDGAPSLIMEFGSDDGLYEIWTDPLNAIADGTAPVELLPPSGGAKFRWFTVLPLPPGVDPHQYEPEFAAAFAAMSSTDVRPNTSRHPGMHQTPTLDFIVVISGRVRLLLDTDERVLEPGDVVVQRGTNHAWVCANDKPALLVAILIDKADQIS